MVIGKGLNIPQGKETRGLFCRGDWKARIFTKMIDGGKKCKFQEVAWKVLNVTRWKRRGGLSRSFHRRFPSRSITRWNGNSYACLRQLSSLFPSFATSALSVLEVECRGGCSIYRWISQGEAIWRNLEVCSSPRMRQLWNVYKEDLIPAM